ncbi:MAG TPA: hypothetical protein VEH81_13375, partial [Ktedonobacteraceae bacterium]|nr:hypothetical protein [Ktedonobacteraceae bacterium]
LELVLPLGAANIALSGNACKSFRVRIWELRDLSDNGENLEDDSLVTSKKPDNFHSLARSTELCTIISPSCGFYTSPKPASAPRSMYLDIY